jgi:hypothetical protein
MISSVEEYKKTKDYTDRLQQILLGLRAAHSAHEYENMSKAYLKELTKAQREIAVYLAVPIASGQLS